MMPWYTMLGMFVVASPVMVLAGVLRGPGLAGVFLLGAVAYFLCYETLHALYHLPDATLDRAGHRPRARLPAAAGASPPPSHPGTDGRR